MNAQAKVGGTVRLEVATQPYTTYVIRRRGSLGAAPETVREMTGDGYLQSVEVPASADSSFFDLVRTRD